MTKRQMIQLEIDRIPAEKLDELYDLIREFSSAPARPNPNGIMARLRTIQIEGPTDLATNLESYLTGEKQFGDDLH